jgi:5-dehydro-2-deoxygluconokinase
MSKALDVITIGRSSVDLYGSQVGGRLEDMRSFQKYIGGSPTNIAVGCSRLELKSALITRVGDEHMGRFISEELEYEGVDTTYVKTDPERLTALVLLGIRNNEEFPLIFYRENCADMALCEEDIEQEFILSSRSLVVTGTHLSNVKTEGAILKSLRIANEGNIKTALDIDYRPNLWGLSGHNDGENRFIKSTEVTEKLQKNLKYFDLIVGTEEEFHIAGGTSITIDALKIVRSISNAVLVCKRGPLGASCFTATIPKSLDDGQIGDGFKIEVFNVLGAGDGFMAGLMKGWLEGAMWSEALTYANACGALAVSRHGCAPAYPSMKELNFFLNRPIENPALRNDKQLDQWHWSTNRKKEWSNLKIFAFDHRKQLEDLEGSTATKIAKFKKLCLDATLSVAIDYENCGILCDNKYGQEVLSSAEGAGLWIGRPCELPGAFPLELENEIGDDCGGLSEWPVDQVVKVLCFYNSNDGADMKLKQEKIVKRLFTSARRNRLEFLLEIISSRENSSNRIDQETVASSIQRFYDIGVYPDWWKLEPFMDRDVWQDVCSTISNNDANTRGILILGLGSSSESLNLSFKIASEFPLVKGFAVGRSIFLAVAQKWMKNQIGDSEVVSTITTNYSNLCDIWNESWNKQLRIKK